MRLKTASAAIIAAAALVLAGCSGSGSDNVAALPGSDINWVDREDLQQGGALRQAINAWPSHFNPMHQLGNNHDNTMMYAYTAPVNWIYDAEGKFEPNPNWFESYELTKAEGDQPQVVTVNLNPKAVWNDGSSITVEDYKATWQACNGSNPDFVCASNDGWSEIESVEAGENEFQVVFTYNVAYPDWSANLSTVLHRDSVKDAATFNDGWKDLMSISDKWFAGPFKFVSADQAKQIITLEPNDKWWGDAPLLDTVTFSVLEANAAATAYANNEIDLVEPIITADIYKTVETRQDNVFKVSGSVQWRHFTVNSNAGALKDQNVRQAVQYAINRADLTASDLAGLPVDPNEMLLGNHFFMPYQYGYKDNSFPHDTAKAEEKLTEAGYVKGEDGKWAKDGNPLVIRYLRMPNVPTSNNEGLVLQSSLDEIGVTVEFTDVPDDQFFDKVLDGEFEITAFTWVGTPYAMANVGQIYGDPESGDQGGSNFAGLKTDLVDELIPQIAAEQDNDKRIDLTNQADAAIWENVHTIPLYYRAYIVAQPANLANYGATAMETIRPENIGYTKGE